MSSPCWSEQRRCHARGLNSLNPWLFHSGMLPCFFGGFVSRLVSSIRSAVISFLRVYFGSMISSMNPRSAAM